MSDALFKQVIGTGRAKCHAASPLFFSLGVTDLSVMRSDIFEASTEAADSVHDERPAQIVL